MTVAQFLARCRTYWYILVLLPLLLTAVSYTKLASNTDYRASISLGLAANSPDFPLASGENYDRYLTTLSEYLANRFKSIEVQKIITTELGLPDSKIDLKKPIYDITNQNSGFVSVSGVFEDKIKAENFLKATKKAYTTIVITEKSNNETSPYKIQAQTLFLETIVEVKTPIQTTLAPTILGLLLALLLTIILPYKNQIKN
jgi:hypothetical protein